MGWLSVGVVVVGWGRGGLGFLGVKHNKRIASWDMPRYSLGGACHGLPVTTLP